MYWYVSQSRVRVPVTGVRRAGDHGHRYDMREDFAERGRRKAGKEEAWRRGWESSGKYGRISQQRGVVLLFLLRFCTSTFSKVSQRNIFGGDRFDVMCRGSR